MENVKFKEFRGEFTKLETLNVLLGINSKGLNEAIKNPNPQAGKDMTDFFSNVIAVLVEAISSKITDLSVIVDEVEEEISPPAATVKANPVKKAPAGKAPARKK